MTPIATVALLARAPGLAVLRDALIDHPRLQLAAVLTHGNLPKGEGGGARPELDGYRRLCDARGVPLRALDAAEARDIASHIPAHAELLVALSWRALVPSPVLERFPHGAINLHRGALPRYAGALPVQRAIEAGERRIAITAHRMTAEIDAGPELARIWLDRPPALSNDAAIEAERIKAMLTPLYAPLARLAIAALLAGAA